MDHESHDQKRVSGTCDTLCNVSIARSIRRDSAPLRGFPENVPIIQRKSPIRGNGESLPNRWCAMMQWSTCVSRLVRVSGRAIRVRLYTRVHTHIHTCIHARERQCFYKRAFVRAGYVNSLTLICRGNTRKITLKHSVGGFIIGRPKLIESREMQ